MGKMSLNEWVAAAGFQREDCFKHGYRDLYLDIGFFNAQFASAEFVLTSLLLAAARPGEIGSAELANGMDAEAKVARFRSMAETGDGIGPHLDARLRVFEEQSIVLRDKLAHSTILPSDDWPDFFEFVSVIEPPEGPGRLRRRADLPERFRADRIWKHGVWLHKFVGDLSAAELTWASTAQFEIPRPRTPVLDEAVF
jgi:hypothetical protein